MFTSSFPSIGLFSPQSRAFERWIGRGLNVRRSSFAVHRAWYADSWRHLQRFLQRDPRIRRRKPCLELRLVLSQSRVLRIRESELTLDHPEPRLGFPPYACLRSLDPIENRVLGLRSLVRVCGRADHRAHLVRFGIPSDVLIHAEVPVAVFLGLAHLGVAFTHLVFRRTRCRDQCCVDNHPALDHQSALLQHVIDRGKDRGGDAVPIEQVTKAQIVFSSGRQRIEPSSSANSQYTGISCSTSFIAGSRRPNRCCSSSIVSKPIGGQTSIFIFRQCGSIGAMSLLYLIRKLVLAYALEREVQSEIASLHYCNSFSLMSESSHGYGWIQTSYADIP